MKLNIVNCFYTKETSSGNPAAIVRGFMEGKNKKQELAKKLNLPVTVFLSEVYREPVTLNSLSGNRNTIMFVWYDRPYLYNI